MPAIGTRKVEIDGKPVFLPEEEARIAALISSGCELQALINEYKGKLQAVKDEIVSIAEKHCGAKASVTLPSATGQTALIKWTRELVVDSFKATELKKALGESWGKVFSVKPKFTLARGYKAFMNAQHGPGMDKVKAQIAKAFSVKVNKPSVTLQDIA